MYLWRMVLMHESKLPALRLLAHVPNGGSRRPAEAAKFRAQGVRPGFPDYLLPVPTAASNGLAVELKACDGRVSEDQDRMLRLLAEAGWRTVVCWGWESAWDEIKRHADAAVWAPQ
jgi:hypothetical protein